jgi:hypothetical protein
MTVAELRAVLGALSGNGASSRPPAERALRSYRRSVKSVVMAMDELTQHRQGVDRSEVKAVHTTLLTAASALAAAFGLSEA